MTMAMRLAAAVVVVERARDAHDCGAPLCYVCQLLADSIAKYDAISNDDV